MGAGVAAAVAGVGFGPRRVSSRSPPASGQGWVTSLNPVKCDGRLDNVLTVQELNRLNTLDTPSGALPPATGGPPGWRLSALSYRLKSTTSGLPIFVACCRAWSWSHGSALSSCNSAWGQVYTTMLVPEPWVRPQLPPQQPKGVNLLPTLSPPSLSAHRQCRPLPGLPPQQPQDEPPAVHAHVVGERPHAHGQHVADGAGEVVGVPGVLEWVSG